MTALKTQAMMAETREEFKAYPRDRNRVQEERGMFFILN